MKYTVFTRLTWFMLLWTQVWCVFDMLVLRFDPVALRGWWFIVACLAQPVCALAGLCFAGKRRVLVAVYTAW